MKSSLSCHHCHTQPQSRTPRARKMVRSETVCYPMGPSIHFLAPFELLGQETHICFIYKFPIGVSRSSLWEGRHALWRGVRFFLLLRSAHLYHSEGDPSDSESLWVSQSTSSHSGLCTSSKDGYHKVIILHPPL